MTKLVFFVLGLVSILAAVPSFADSGSMGGCGKYDQDAAKFSKAIASLGTDRSADYWRPMLAGQLGAAVEKYAACVNGSLPAGLPELCRTEKKRSDDAEARFEAQAPDDPADYNDDTEKLDLQRIAASESYLRCLESTPRSPEAQN